MVLPQKKGKIHRVTQTEVQRYIIVNLLPQCVADPLPFHERELARTMKVNRLTVRRAARELLAKGLMIQIPGRRGLFLNPECKGNWYKEKYFGILIRRGDIPTLCLELNQILKGFFDSARLDHYSDCQFLTLTTDTPERIAAEIRSYPLHALIWFSPLPESYPVIDLLLEQQLPVVIINSVNDSRISPHSSNTFLLDYVQEGKLFAEKVLRSSCRKILFAGLNGITLDSFRKVLTEQDFKFTMRDFMEYSPQNHDPEKLASVIRKRKIEMVISNGMVYHDLDKIAALTDLSGVTFLLPPMRHVICGAAEHPEYHILFPEYSFDGALELMGHAIAEKISAPSPILRFPNRIIPMKDNSKF
ncbi:MAG: GntR family transcriptional regulator [Lentisphaeria bacterium]|nr:GntR family transcriptional regulator [Lentisphaeria bacterium]